MSTVNISNIISEMCEKAEISQAVVAGITGKAQTRVSGQLKNDTFTTDEVFLIADALNCEFMMKCVNSDGECTINSNDGLYTFLRRIEGLQEKIGVSKPTFDSRMKGENFKFADVIRGLSDDYDITIDVDMSDMTDKDILYQKYYKSGLSEEARLKKNERQKEYLKKTHYAATQKHRKKSYVRLEFDERKEIAEAYKEKCKSMNIPYVQPLHEAVLRFLEEK